MSEFGTIEIKPRAGLAPIDADDWVTSTDVRHGGAEYTERCLIQPTAT